jgi:signal transduction histidine kinase/DNA-binding NarL/FixJ family response regulator/ligand-binding sensor domain-containing protein
MHRDKHSLQQLPPSAMRLRIVFVLLFGVLVLASPPKVLCQIRHKSGFKYFKNYSSSEYEHAPQNWSILQDNRGVIYVANQGGLLQFDGVTWQSIDIPNKSARSLAIDKSGTIYVGGRNEIGYLAPDSKGTLRFNSLMTHLVDKQINFGYVWNTIAAKEGVYFQTTKHLLRWNAGQLNLLQPGPGSSFHTSFLCNGTFFVRQRGIGLMHIVNGSLKLVPGGKTYASSKVFMMAPYDDQKILIGTRSSGFYLYDGTSSIPFPTKADQYLKKNHLLHGIRLSTGDFALATRLGGLVIINLKGELRYVLNTSSGLQVNNVKYVFEDNQDNLWLALVKGITKFENSSPISVYDDRLNLPELVLSVVKHENYLISGTTRGLYILESPLSKQFLHVPGISVNCWSILSIDNFVLAATTHGVFQVEKKYENWNSRRILGGRSYVLYRSKKDTNRIWLGASNGLISLYRKSNIHYWQEEYKFESITGTVKTIVENQAGNLWLGLLTEKVLWVEFPDYNQLNYPVVTRYDKSHGLPDGVVRVFKIKDHVVFASDNGLYFFNPIKQIFVPDSILGNEFAGGEKGKPVFRIVEDRDKNIWFHSDRRNIVAVHQADGSYIINKKPFLRLPPGQANTIYPDPDGNTVWFADNDGLIRFDKRVKKNYDLNFKTIISKVSTNEVLQFDGYKTVKTDTSGNENQSYTFDYINRNIRFQFVAPFFEGESVTQYRYRLDGYDKNWSPLTSDTQKNYTNLDSGQYTFHVQALNVYGNYGSEDHFQFKILPPWFQTWWAYLLYTVAAFSLLLLLFKWRSRKLISEKERLERIVYERTQEIEDKNQQLEEQSEKLKEMDQIKSRFFANISHEFRTPLTLLMGPLKKMIAACSDKETEKKRQLTLMLRNAQRLLRLINQLLELSRLDSGKMKLQPVKIDVVSFVKGITDSFRFLVQQKEMDLVFQVERENETKEGEILLYIDPRKMEDIMSNLLINAIKFTPAGGEIRVTVKEVEKFVEISVSDTGPGIPADQLAHVFDRFYQADATYEHYQKGSGIGLALSKELVELHHGTITARSNEGDGTTFTVLLPKGTEHLTADEIIEPGNRKNTNGYETLSNISAEIVRLEKELEKEGQETETTNGFDLDRESSVDEPNIILVVEDSTDMREYIKEALEPDFRVVEAEDGKEGVQKAQEIIPDLIISDIMMPQMDGYELCRTLKSDVQTSHIPVILLTAKAAEENIVEGLETGADDYITKPFSTLILSARIKNLIDIRSQLQQNVKREMTMQPVKTSVSKIDREFLKDLQAVLKENVGDPEFNVEEMCKRLYMGNTTLYRKVQALSGQSPTEFLRTYRLKQAAQLLKSGFGSVTEVAFEVGFSSRAYFTKCFKEKFHQLPSEYSEANRQ